MNMPKNKPIIPSMRLLVRACPYFPESMAFTVDHAKNASMIAGMNKIRNTVRITKNGTVLTLAGGVIGSGNVTVDTAAAKIIPVIRRPRIANAAVMT